MRDILSASERLLTDKEILEIEEEAKEIKKQNVLYFDTPKTINKMAETIGWVWDKYKKPMLMFLDHSILVQKSAHHNTTTDMLYELGQFWNIIKKQYPITAFIASQLNREIESSDRKKVPTMHYPQKGDFSYSDGLYMSADMVIVSHIPYMLNLQFYGPQRLPCTQEDVYWHILKNRNNEANKVIRMKADFKNMKIIERNDS